VAGRRTKVKSQRTIPLLNKERHKRGSARRRAAVRHRRISGLSRADPWSVGGRTVTSVRSGRCRGSAGAAVAVAAADRTGRNGRRWSRAPPGSWWSDRL
jgi:hypothetical protein